MDYETIALLFILLLCIIGMFEATRFRKKYNNIKIAYQSLQKTVDFFHNNLDLFQRERDYFQKLLQT